MADITKKHHELISDCIVGGLQKFSKVYGEEECRTAGLVVKYIIKEFGNRLRYTHDKFDSELFQRKLRITVKNVLNEHRRKGLLSKGLS